MPLGECLHWCNVCLCRYEIRTDVFMSLLPCYYITTMLLAPVPASHDTNGIVSGTIWSRRSKCSERCATWLIWSHEAGICITRHSWHCQWYHHILKVKTTWRRCSMMFWFMWGHWHQYLHHMMLQASSIAPLYLLGQKIEMRCYRSFLDTWHHWCQHSCHMIAMASSMINHYSH